MLKKNNETERLSMSLSITIDQPVIAKKISIRSNERKIKLRHSWEQHPENLSLLICKVCGCTKDKKHAHPYYLLNGKTFHKAPECRKSLRSLANDWYNNITK